MISALKILAVAALWYIWIRYFQQFFNFVPPKFFSNYLWKKSFFWRKFSNHNVARLLEVCI